MIDHSNGYYFEDGDEEELIAGKIATVYRIFDKISAAEYIPCRLEFDIQEVKRARRVISKS
jgi:hypothetical protein